LRPLLAVDEIKQLFKIQAYAIIVIVILAMTFGSLLIAESALAGALVFFVPNIIFAKNSFKYQGAQSAKQIVSAFYKSEALKIVISIFLFAMVFSFFIVIPLVFFVVYITMQLVMWGASFYVTHIRRL
jgi:ATP synthase protein I